MRAFIPRFTLAGFLLVIAGLAGLYGSITGHIRPGLVQTHSPLDVCVVGNGHIIASGLDPRQYLAIRSARMYPNPQGQLVIRHKGTEFLIEPNINIPMDATWVAIAPDGQVFYRTLGSDTKCIAGQLQLGTFPSTAFFRPMGDSQIVSPVVAMVDESPTIAVPGDPNFGHIQSGLLIRQPSWMEATFFVGRDVFLAACGLVAIQSLWANWGWRKPVDAQLGVPQSS